MADMALLPQLSAIVTTYYIDWRRGHEGFCGLLKLA